MKVIKIFIAISLCLFYLASCGKENDYTTSNKPTPDVTTPIQSTPDLTTPSETTPEPTIPVPSTPDLTTPEITTPNPTTNIQNVVISKIELEYIASKYLVNINFDLYQVSLEKSAQYTYVTIIVVPYEGYVLDPNLEFYVNDKLIDKSLYEIKDNVLTYTFKDSNWSSIV